MSLFKKAVKAESKLRLAIAGPSGSGKTYTSLAIASVLAAGKPIALDASGSFDPARGGGGDLTYTWDFGDGAKSDGATASHTYAAPGTYLVTLTVRSPSGTRQVHKTLAVTRSAPYYPNPHDGNPPGGYPAPNPNVLPRLN